MSICGVQRYKIESHIMPHVIPDVADGIPSGLRRITENFTSERDMSVLALGQLIFQLTGSQWIRTRGVQAYLALVQCIEMHITAGFCKPPWLYVC